jgi:hypothetical protein
MTRRLADMKGLDPDLQQKLASIKITTIEQLLAKAGTPAQRSILARQIGTSPGQLADCVNRAGLMRLRGVNADVALLLEECGVDSVKDLQHRKAASLQANLKAANEQKRLIRQSPSLDQVQDWIAEASSIFG